MKKTFLTSIIALAALVAMPAAAQTDGTSDATRTEQCAKDCKKKEKKLRHAGRHDMNRSNAFEGITLSEEQKEALKALRPQRPEKRERQQADSVAPRDSHKKMRAEYVNGVKQILTPDQYVVFLENIVINDAMIPGGNEMRQHGPKGPQGVKGHGKDVKHKGAKDGKGPKARTEKKD